MEFALPDVSQEFQKTKYFLHEIAQKAVISVTDAGEKANNQVKIQGFEKSYNNGKYFKILKRLEAIKQEPDVLLKELAVLVKAENLKAK